MRDAAGRSAQQVPHPPLHAHPPESTSANTEHAPRGKSQPPACSHRIEPRPKLPPQTPQPRATFAHAKAPTSRQRRAAPPAGTRSRRGLEAAENTGRVFSRPPGTALTAGASRPLLERVPATTCLSRHTTFRAHSLSRHTEPSRQPSRPKTHAPPGHTRRNTPANTRRPLCMSTLQWNAHKLAITPANPPITRHTVAQRRRSNPRAANKLLRSVVVAAPGTGN